MNKTVDELNTYTNQTLIIHHRNIRILIRTQRNNNSQIIVMNDEGINRNNLINPKHPDKNPDQYPDQYPDIFFSTILPIPSTDGTESRLLQETSIAGTDLE